jgi:hypothetical protein
MSPVGLGTKNHSAGEARSSLTDSQPQRISELDVALKAEDVRTFGAWDRFKTVAIQRGEEAFNKEAKEPTLLEVVTRRRLVKTNWEDLAHAMVNCKVRELEKRL